LLGRKDTNLLDSPQQYSGKYGSSLPTLLPTLLDKHAGYPSTLWCPKETPPEGQFCLLSLPWWLGYWVGLSVDSSDVFAYELHGRVPLGVKVNRLYTPNISDLIHNFTKYHRLEAKRPPLTQPHRPSQTIHPFSDPQWLPTTQLDPPWGLSVVMDLYPLLEHHPYKLHHNRI